MNCKDRRSVNPSGGLLAYSPNKLETTLTFKRIPICVAALCFVCSCAVAGVPKAAVFPKEKASKPPLPYRAVGLWGVAASGQQVAVQWESTPFTRDQSRGHHADAKIRLRKHQTAGLVKAEVIKASDSTNIEKGRRKAKTVAAVKGKGLAYLMLELEIDQAGCPSGEYSATVDVTISPL